MSALKSPGKICFRSSEQKCRAILDGVHVVTSQISSCVWDITPKIVVRKKRKISAVSNLHFIGQPSVGNKVVQDVIYPTRTKHSQIP